MNSGLVVQSLTVLANSSSICWAKAREQRAREGSSRRIRRYGKRLARMWARRPCCLRFSCLCTTNLCVIVHTRRLPHLESSDAEFFVTFRLYGSLPMAAQGAAPHAATAAAEERRSAGEEFVALDRELDRALAGLAMWLREATVAECVSRVLVAGMVEWRFYELVAWVIMANHVHALIQPRVPLGKALMMRHSR